VDKILGRYAKNWIFPQNKILQYLFFKVSARLYKSPVCKLGLHEISMDQPGDRVGVRLEIGMHASEQILKKDDVDGFSSVSDSCFMSSAFFTLA
jgi:hypothetical protein